MNSARSVLASLVSLLLLATPASALTLYQLSGSGDITIDVDGSVSLDLGSNVFDTIRLSAATSVVVDADGTLPATDATLVESDATGFAGTFSEDVVFEILSWSGTIEVAASESIFVLSGIGVTDPDAGCDPAGGLVIGTGDVLPVGDPCDGGLVIGPRDDGGVVIVGIEPEAAIPEPTAAVVFAVGLLLVAGRARRIS